MNPYTLDFSKYYDDIVSVLKTIFGYEYSSIIDERFQNIVITTYSNKEGIKAYHSFLEDSKSRELCIKFLERIGIDLSEFNITNYADRFTGKLEKLVNKYLEGYFAFKGTFQVFPDTFRAFFQDESKLCEKETILDNRIKFINSIRNAEPITRDNFSEFMKTEEYKKILLLCEKYNSVYLELVDEMNSYMESIKEYKEYYEKENARYREILSKKTTELYEDIEALLTYDIVMSSLDGSMYTNELIDKLFAGTVDTKLFIEYFSDEDESILNNSKVSDYDKKWLLYYRKKYFVNMGINIDAWNDDYYEVIKRDDVKRVFPSKELVDEIVRLRPIKLESATKEFICESDTFKRAVKNFADDDACREYTYRIIRDNRVCVHAGVINGKFIPLMFLTLRREECGVMDYVILHETIHAIESESIGGGNYRCGFEPAIFYAEPSPYIYSNSKRKYERMNETITDMFAIEAWEILHTLGVYFEEEKTRTKSIPNNNNTSSILKEMLRPFLERYRSLIINARICGTIDELKMCIGEYNYEELNNIVDYVDTLIDMGLENRLHENKYDNKLVIEYNLQLQRLDGLYKRMDEHYSKYIKTKKKS